MEKPEFQTVTAGDEILVFCTVALWYGEGDGMTMSRKCTVYGVGGDKVLGKNRNGPFTNDEAFKASYTDALSNAMKQIGVGADIHMGLFDDEKYASAETQREFAGGGQGAALEQAAREITAATGESRSTYQIEKDKKAVKPKITPKEWADDVIVVLNNAPSLEVLNDWWKANREKLDALEEKAPDQYERVVMVAEDARASLRNH